MAEKPLDALLDDNQPAPVVPSPTPETPPAVVPPVVPATPVPQRGGTAANRIQQVISKSRQALADKDAEIARLQSELAKKAPPALDDSPEDFVADVVDKTVNPRLDRVEQALVETEIKSAVATVPGADKYIDEIRKYGEVHSTLPWSDVVKLVMTNHNAMPNVTIDATASNANLGGQPNPGARRDTAVRAKTTAQLEQELRNAGSDEIADSINSGLF